MDDAPDPDSIQLLRNGREAFPAWLEAIASARDEILLEMYWFASDRTGRKFADALIERARAGVDVFVIYDAIGSLGSDRAMFDELIAAGAKVAEYHPIAPWSRRFRWERVTLRDHRKILVVDATIAFTGGINICDQSAPREEGGGGWRDDAVRLIGPAVLELRALFFDTWLKLGGPSPRRGDKAVRRKRRELIAAARLQAGTTASVPPPSLFERISRVSFPSVREARELTRRPASEIRPPPAIQVFGHAASGARRTIRNLYVRHIRHAQSHILIANSYFVPDGTIRRALVLAARRGVEVRVLVPEQSDVPSVGYAGRALYARLMRAGVHVHLWIEGMMHAKTAVIDRWATTGSYNLDYRSLRYNLEANVATSDAAFVDAVEAGVRADLARSREVDPVEWARRPWYERVFEWANYLLRRLL